MVAGGNSANSFALAVLAQFSADALNHMLVQNNWALQRLICFAGKTARFDITPFSFAYNVQTDGTLRSADITATADAVCVVTLSLLPRLLLRDEKAFAEICTEGDAALLNEIFFMMHSLRWDAAKDISRITGGNAVKRMLQQGQRLHETAETLTRMAADYFTEEHQILVRTQQFSEFMQQLDELRDGVARIDQRIKQLLSDQ